MIALVQPIHDANAMSGCRVIPSHCWLNDETLAIGWANSVCICVILPGCSDQASVCLLEFQIYKIRFYRSLPSLIHMLR